MPQLNNVHVSAKCPKSGEEFSYSAAASVSKDGGVFWVELHPALTNIAEKLTHTEKWRYQNIGFKHSHGRLKLECRDLSKGQQFLCTCAADYLSVETTTQRVIVYGQQTAVAFWQGEDQKIYPSGAYKVNGTWRKFQDGLLEGNDHTNFYTLGVSAVVFDKVTSHRPSGDTVHYERVRIDLDDANTQAEKDICWLNGFVRLSIDPEDSQFKQMPYTPEAASFFLQLMLQICRMADSMEKFLTDDRILQLAIKNTFGGNGLKLLPI